MAVELNRTGRMPPVGVCTSLRPISRQQPTRLLFTSKVDWFLDFSTNLEPPTISVRLDFLKCVQIFLSSKTQICTVRLDLLYLQLCVANEKI